MRCKPIRAIALTMLTITLLLPCNPGPVAPVDALGHGGPGGAVIPPAPIWSDDLDDLGKVYVPTGGLVGIEVTGGSARLQSGSNEGWLASEVIHARDGHKYDLVMLEVDTPGGSKVEISLLNASAEASEVGYANETIPGLRRIEASDLLVYTVNPEKYPTVRIQVNLVANGTYRPRLLSWSLTYIPVGEWRTDLLSGVKLTSERGVNITDGVAEINLTSPSHTGPGQGDYEPYPTVVSVSGTNGVYAYYPNTGHTGYDYPADLGADDYPYGVAIDDLDQDGNMDLIICRQQGNSVILMGDSSGTWSTNNPAELTTTYGQKTATGDFNGDGWADIAIGCYATTSASSVVFLNDGQGSFNTQPDITFQGMRYNRVKVGDMNSDGYDDIGFANRNEVGIYFGGPDGPDTTADIGIATVNCYNLHIADLDLDGHLDLALGDRESGRSRIFLGGPSGPDTTADYSLSFGLSWVPGVSSGDINGDGYIDMCYYSSSGNGYYTMYIFPGSATGWSISSMHEGYIEAYSYAMVVADLDKDGYDDIVLSHRLFDFSGYATPIFMGGTTLPTDPDVTIDQGGQMDLAIALPKGQSSTKAFYGSIETVTINRPLDKRWDVLAWEGQTPPNTSIEVTILDDKGKRIEGYEALNARSVDLSGLNRNSIRIAITLTSEFNWTTPVLDGVIVKWIDQLTWRDQFLGSTKTERLVNLDVDDGFLKGIQVQGSAPQLLFPSLRNDEGFNSKSECFLDDGKLDFSSLAPIHFNTRGASAVAVADVNGDAIMDMAFSTYQTSDNNFMASSPLFLGHASGWRSQPDHSFPSIGAADILLEDLNGDGHCDVVIAQERDGDDYLINSTLFWGREGGWNSTPDVQFLTTGASGVVASDLDGDGRLDLAFSCYRSSTTSTDSLVFIQRADGDYCSTADHRLPTKGAQDLAAGDIDGDGHQDLVFANAFAGGYAELDSFIYWGSSGGGFETEPASLATKGARAVTVEDVDNDGDLDVIFANYWDNNRDRTIDSYLYLLDGDRTEPSGPAATFPTIGASGVAAADLDGSGRMDLVFACSDNGTSFSVSSRVFMGDASGWSNIPDVLIPTKGASAVVVTQLVASGTGSYMSKPISVDPVSIGTFGTLRCDASLGGSHGGRVMLVDADSWEVLFEAPIADGETEWRVNESFKVKAHPSIRVVIVAEGLEQGGTFNLDELWLNWSMRAPLPPRVLDFGVAATEVYRLSGVAVNVTVFDEYDPSDELTVIIEHRLNTSANWERTMIGTLQFKDDAWHTEFRPRADVEVGTYLFRVFVRDTDGETSGYVEVAEKVFVLNNLPTRPEVRVNPARPITTATLTVEMVQPASDIESHLLQYLYQWYRNGVPVPGATSDRVLSSNTTKGDNWTVEVCAFDGEDDGPVGTAWRIIQNAPPVLQYPMTDPELSEDVPDSDWLDLSHAFSDPDGDDLEFTVDPIPVHISVHIDMSTGRVTLVPEENWSGSEEITFVASDGELSRSQTVEVTVVPVNDQPRIVGIDGFGIPSDPVEFTIMQGEGLIMTVNVVDVEGDELLFEVNSTQVDVDPVTGEIRFVPANDAVGSLRFGLWVSDVVSPLVKVTLNFTIHVENENDPMDPPKITHPADGSKYKENTTFILSATCFDPDVQYGQELEFIWASNISGDLGRGNSLEVTLLDVGTHMIILTVTDGQYQKTARMDIIIEAREVIDDEPIQDPDPNSGDGGLSTSVILAIALAILGAFGAAGYTILTKRRADNLDDEEAEEAEEEELDKDEVLRRMAAAAKESADILEGSMDDDEQAWVETGDPDGVQVDSTSVPDMQLSMEATVTKSASKDVQNLWANIGSEATVVEEDKEQLRLDNLKRKYQNTIGRLPYGIPSKELAEWEWTDLAAALATGEKRTVDQGREVTQIDGRWYFSDMDDTGSFLKEHGAKANVERKKTVTADKEALLTKLEERFILGEISEEAYKDLKEKYGG